jgi:hypothetical protein
LDAGLVVAGVLSSDDPVSDAFVESEQQPLINKKLLIVIAVINVFICNLLLIWLKMGGRPNEVGTVNQW